MTYGRNSRRSTSRMALGGYYGFEKKDDMSRKLSTTARDEKKLDIRANGNKIPDSEMTDSKRYPYFKAEFEDGTKTDERIDTLACNFYTESVKKSFFPAYRYDVLMQNSLAGQNLRVTSSEFINMVRIEAEFMTADEPKVYNDFFLAQSVTSNFQVLNDKSVLFTIPGRIIDEYKFEMFQFKHSARICTNVLLNILCTCNEEERSTLHLSPEAVALAEADEALREQSSKTPEGTTVKRSRPVYGITKEEMVEEMVPVADIVVNADVIKTALQKNDIKVLRTITDFYNSTALHLAQINLENMRLGNQLTLPGDLNQKINDSVLDLLELTQQQNDPLLYPMLINALDKTAGIYPIRENVLNPKAYEKKLADYKNLIEKISAYPWGRWIGGAMLKFFTAVISIGTLGIVYALGGSHLMKKGTRFMQEANVASQMHKFHSQLPDKPKTEAGQEDEKKKSKP